MKTPPKELFFVGWAQKTPPGLRRFLPVAAVILMSAFAGLGFAIGSTQDDPGGGAFRWDLGRQELAGVIHADPHPTLRIVDGNAHFPAGHLMLLTGEGKRGAMAARDFDGALVRVAGVALARGELDMLQLAGDGGPEPVAGAVPELTADEPLGRWRLTGEICDGKCWAGAMRPGGGISHRACANLCLIGEIPPVFVSTGGVEGARTFLLAGPDGGAMPPELLDLTAVLIEVEGEVHRRGDLLIFRADPATARAL